MCSSLGTTNGHRVVDMLFVITVTLFFEALSGQSVQSPGLLITEYTASNQSSSVRYVDGDISSIYGKLRDDNLDSVILTDDAASRKVGISYDFSESLLFWADTLGQSVVRYSLLDGSEGTLYNDTSSSLEDLTVDWSGKNVYVTDSANRRIVMCNYAGSCRPIVTEVESVSSVAVEPTIGYLYWSTMGASPKIERAGLDGDNREIIVSSENTPHGTIHSPLGLVVGYSKRFYDERPVQRIFWLDQYYKTYMSADLDGSMTHVDFTEEDTGSDETLNDLDLTPDYYILTDFGDGEVRLVDRALPSVHQSIRSTDGQPTSAVYFDGGRQVIAPGKETTTTDGGITAPPGGVTPRVTPPRTPQPTQAGATRMGTAKTGVTYATLTPGSREGPTGGVSTLQGGLILGAVVLLLLIVSAIIIVCLWRRRNRESTERQVRDHHLELLARPLPDEPVYASISEQNEDAKDENGALAAPTSDAYQPLLVSNTDDARAAQRQNDERVPSGSEADYSYQKMTVSDDQGSDASPRHSYVNVDDQSGDRDNSEYTPMESGLGGFGEGTAGGADDAGDDYYQPDPPLEREKPDDAYPIPEDDDKGECGDQNPENGDTERSEPGDPSSVKAEPYIEVIPDPDAAKANTEDSMSDSDSITYC